MILYSSFHMVESCLEEFLALSIVSPRRDFVTIFHCEDLWGDIFFSCEDTFPFFVVLQKHQVFPIRLMTQQKINIWWTLDEILLTGWCYLECLEGNFVVMGCDEWGKSFIREYIY